MRESTRVPLVLSAILLAASGARATEGRSFVGRKLSGITFVDTEGHTIDPEHYRGAVLVMIGGIPW